ncbi:MAG: hypothetical protein ACFFDN_03870 [Candidatus Hodarchaeota archaeon]
MSQKKLIFLILLQIFVISTIFLVDSLSTINYLPPLADHKSSTLSTSTNDDYILWDDEGTIISIASNNQGKPQICSDGNGGAIIVWQDLRNGPNVDIYAQKILKNGSVQWTANGTPISTANSDQLSPRICSDGAGGAIITWYDGRDGPDYDIYTQKIDSSGNVKWTANGTAICTSNKTQAYPMICSDGAGGAIITWYDYRSSIDYDIYAQKILSSGSVQWTANGTAICTAIGTQLDQKICSDGAGGAIITWNDYRNGNYDIYAQKILLTGSVQWTANGIAICTYNNYQGGPKICSDGAGGAIITWNDWRGIDYDIYTQKINSTGNVQWTANGTAICTASNDQTYPEICSDGAGGAIITWEDKRNGGIKNTYAQKILSSGSVQWTANGTAVCTTNNDQLSAKICSDGVGGAIITWEEERSGIFTDIYAQKVNSTGHVQWTAYGTAICTASYDQSDGVICSDGTGGAIIAWVDWRTGGYSNIYAQNIISDSKPTSSHPDDIATTMEGSETVAWILHDDWDGGKYRVWVDSGIWVDWTDWNVSYIIIVPIYRGGVGTYNYTIEYYDSHNQYGIPDSVIVTINTPETPGSPSEESPIFISGGQGDGDITSFLLSPLGIGLIAVFVAIFLILIIFVINNNKTVKELDKKISETPITKKSIKK